MDSWIISKGKEEAEKQLLPNSCPVSKRSNVSHLTMRSNCYGKSRRLRRDILPTKFHSAT